MTQKITLLLTTVLSIILSSAVILVGMHAKELTSLSKSNTNSITINETQVRKAAVDDGGVIKVQADYHSHVDHQNSKSIVKVFGENANMNVDARNLRKVRHARRHAEANVFSTLFSLFPLRA